MCSRILYETGTGTYITGRGMDWNDPNAVTRLWILPRGLSGNGNAGADPITWTSKYGSVVTSMYDVGVADGMNEKGLAGNMLYLTESDYSDPAKSHKKTLSIGAWLQYFLDQYATVKECVDAMQDPPFIIICPTLPNGRGATMHLSLGDTSGDSAIFEYIDGKLVIHHGPDCKVMTNSPIYEQQIALNTYWDQIGGNKFLPGTISAADRFVRLSYNLKSSPKYKDREMAIASVFSQMRSIGVPLGMEDPNLPNISATLWRTVSDHDAKLYYFETTVKPAVFWVDLGKVDFNQDAEIKMLDVATPDILFGEVSDTFKPAKFIEWIK